MSIPGLIIKPEFITESDESHIINWLDTKSWSTELSRRTQHYGYKYGYKVQKATPTTPIEGPLLHVCKFISDNLFKVDQCIVNEYYRNQGISSHTDSNIFGPNIAIISLSGDTNMTFSNASESVDIFLPKRSLTILTGPARYEYKHAINKNVSYVVDNTKIVKSDNYRRISLTYRSLNITNSL